MPLRCGLAACAVLLLLACSAEPERGPREVSWDRETCERCGMIVGDRRSAGQVRDADGHLHVFDDVGCALHWLEESASSGGTALEIWARDAEGEDWVDARQTRFAEGRETPMGYGFGAATASDEVTLDLDQVRTALRERKRDRRRDLRR